MKDIIKALSAPFPETEVEWRVDHGYKTSNGVTLVILAYISARAVMNRLDEVVPGKWSCTFREWKGTNQICTLSIYSDELKQWIAREDGAENSDIEAVKGGLSSALKRAGVQWGIGRYLYEVEAMKVPLLDRGDNYVKIKIGGEEQKGYWSMPVKQPAQATTRTQATPKKDPASPLKEELLNMIRGNDELIAKVKELVTQFGGKQFTDLVEDQQKIIISTIKMMKGV